MTRFRTPISLQVVIWLISLSLVPLLIVYAFMQLKVQETYIGTRLETLENQARLFSDRLTVSGETSQDQTIALNKVMPDNTFFLLGVDGKYITHSDPAKVGTSATDDIGLNIVREILSRASATYSYPEKGILLASYRANLSDPAAVTSSKINSRFAPLSGLTNSIMLQLALALLGVALAIGIVMTSMLNPATQLVEFANQLRNRNFGGTLTPSRFGGELGVIAESLTQVSKNFQVLVSELEQKVVDRTHELERRANQLKATAEVGKAITSVRNLSELLQQTTQLINERFGYYHVGIFLLDDRKNYAVLSASNSDGGRRMLEKGHRLKVGETGIVGYVTDKVEPRIALDVGQDAVFFDNPDLPNTRSEIALPLVASGQILGALDVQSTEPQAFTEEDVSALQTLADQIAIAIQNAYLNNEAEKALETAKQVSGELSRDAWKRLMRYQTRIGYIATPPGAIQTQSETLEPSMATAFESGEIVHVNDGLTISLPIKIRGESIGAIRMKKAEISEAWTQDEINLATSLSDQLSGALESARLYRESQQRAVRESLVSDISARISATSRVEAIVRETVQELGQTIGNAKITFQLQVPSDDSEPVDGSFGSDSMPRDIGMSRD